MTPFRYLSVCSGMDAATLAFEPLGWRPLAFAEIEQAPRAVLKHHWPDVPLFGDFTRLRDDTALIGRADMLVGGTPCQGFSLAGLRGSLSDDRSNLCLEFVRLANAIDDLRRAAGAEPSWILWENVPGVLSTHDNAFGAFLAGLVGSDAPLVSRSGWQDAGVVDGPRRCAAWRVLDAQFFGLAQRRARVFVLAVEHPRGWAAPDALLPLIESVRWHPAPRRKAREDVAGTIRASAARRGGVQDQSGAEGLVAFGGNNTAGGIEIATAVRAKGGTGHGDFESETFIVAGTLTGAGAIASDPTQITQPTNRSNPRPCDPVHTLAAAAHPPAIAFSCKDYGQDQGLDVAPTLRAMNETAGNANAGGQLAVAFNARQDPDLTGDLSGPLDTDGASIALQTAWAVRRLTPRESPISASASKSFAGHWPRRRDQGARDALPRFAPTWNPRMGLMVHIGPASADNGPYMTRYS